MRKAGIIGYGRFGKILADLLSKKYEVKIYDPWIDKEDPPLENPAVFFIGTNHDKFLDYKFSKGSVVIDPWGMMPEQDGVKYVFIGRNSG